MLPSRPIARVTASHLYAAEQGSTMGDPGLTQTILTSRLMRSPEPPNTGPQWHLHRASMPFACHFNDFLFCFTTCNLPHVLVNSVYFFSAVACVLDAFMGIDFLCWFPKEVLFLEPERHSSGLRCLPLCAPIYCSPGFYSLSDLQPSLIHSIFLDNQNGTKLLLIGEKMSCQQAEWCLSL